MENLGTFILNNWLLFLALIVIVGLLFVNLGKARLLGFKEIAANDAVALINHENAIIIDTRGDDEFKQGHILNAVHAPLALLNERMTELQHYRERTVVVYCDSGRQSAHAAATLRSNGFTTLYKLRGGLMAWKSAGLPLERGTARQAS
jgi:rhodanese-related sulfurtransferase